MPKSRRNKTKYSSLGDHTRKRKTLEPPFAKIAKMSFASWVDDRLPEVLWAVLLTGGVEREIYLGMFRHVVEQARILGEDRVTGIEHSELVKLTDEDFDCLFGAVLKSSRARASLKFLLLFENLPDLHHWYRHLGDDPEIGKENILASAVSRTLDHQSEASTDCRWLRIVFRIALGKLIYPPDMRERVMEIIEYPNRGDLKSVRPHIRASEISMRIDDTTWSHAFWLECLQKSDCISARRITPKASETENLLSSYGWLYTGIAFRFHETLKTTGVDAKHDAVFGFGLYSLSLAIRLVQTHEYARPGGRVVIRTIVESLITLSFLIKKDSEELWKKYRHYGTAQAKLTFLKLYKLEDSELPDFVNIDELERLANEDIWQEFSSIELGSWSGSDLRKMSEEAGIKDIYDKYYGWPSGYTHAHWGAVRDSVFDPCLNPLHRFHRIPSLPRIDMPSVLPDLAKLINLILDRINSTYGPFKERVGALPPEDIGTDVQAST